MKLLIDAHLPISLCSYFENCDCKHTRNMENGNFTKDTFINDLSIKEKRAVITKDTDFYYSYLTSQRPYKLVLVRLGNMKLAELKKYFEANSPRIIQLLKDYSFIILEKEKIKIQD